MGDTGLEQSAPKPLKTLISIKRGAKCGALNDKNDSDLARFIEAWPTLPKNTKTTIKHLIEEHIGKQQE